MRIVKTALRIFLFIIIGIFALIILLGIAGRLTLGTGEVYEDLSTAPKVLEGELEIVASMDMPLGNPAVSSAGRIFFNLHPLASPEGPTVFEWVDGAPVPYPDEGFQDEFRSVLGMFIDSQNRLWTLDSANTPNQNSRLLAFDLTTNEIVFDHTFGSEGTNLNDLQVSPDGQTIYFSDPGLPAFRAPALVVFDVESREVRRLLEGHHSVQAQDQIVEIDDEPVWFVPQVALFQLGVDGIALSKDGVWLYYGGITNEGLYRVRTADLLDTSLAADELAARVERVGQKPLSDGFSIDVEGNVYITDVENHGIARMAPDGTLETLVRDERVRWADGISFGPDGWVYFTDSDIPGILRSLLPGPSADLRENGPYHLFRFQSDIEGVPGG